MTNEYSDGEKEAIKRYKNGDKLQFSTDITDTLSYGYGELSNHGFWEFPLPYEELRIEHKELVDNLSQNK